MRKKTFHCLMLAALVAGTATPVLGGGFYIDHFGARGAAMGNTYLGRPTSCTTIFHNPAGLALLEESEVRADLRVAWIESEFDPAGDYPMSEEEAGAQFSPFVGTSMNLGKLSLGLGVYTPFGNKLEYNEGWGRYQLTAVDLKTIYVTPALAYQLTDSFSVGAGISYVYASIDETLHQPNPVDLDGDGYPDVLGDPEWDIVGDIEVDDTASFGFNCGVHYHQGPLFIGASYSYHPTLDMDGDVELRYPEMMGLPAYTDRVRSFEHELCDTARLGLGYQVCPVFFLQAEIDWIGWGENEQFVVDFEEEGTYPYDPLEDMVVHKEWEDTLGFRLGGEFALNDNIMFRAGYEYDEGAIPEETTDLTVPDADKHMVSIGGGYHTGALQFDLAWLHFMIDDTTVTYSKHDNPMLPFSTHQGTYEAALDWLHITLGYLF